MPGHDDRMNTSLNADPRDPSRARAGERLALGADKYRIEGVLGEGGMGTVYLAVDQDLGRQVALKVMRGSATQAAVRRFLEEAQVMGQLEHPGIVAVHEVGLTRDGILYYTMPVVRGRSLAEVTARLRDGSERESWSIARRATVWLRVAEAVAFAHARGVVHRDLKPGNVMLGAHGEVQVLDWGLALLLPRSELETVAPTAAPASPRLVGTPGYMGPEQAAGESVDEGADIWALGAMLYELLTLRRPFEGETGVVLQAVGRDEVVAPRRLDPEIPLELEQICLRALARSRGDRWGRVEGMTSAVAAWHEATAERSRRHERAQALVAEARQLLGVHRGLKEELRRREAELGARRAAASAWQPMAEKLELMAAETRVGAARREEAVAVAAVLSKAERAIAFEEDNAAARELLADHYWERFVAAERRQDRAQVQLLGRRVADYHDGKYGRELQGDGSLTLTSEPAGARVTVLELVEEGYVLVERNARELGTTPLAATRLSMGSYVLILRLDGFRDVRYPVHITRNRDWTGHVRLYTDVEIGAGLIFIPAGPFVFGGDDVPFRALPRAELELPDFAIGRFHITNAEYLEFLNDTARRESLAAARAHAPRDYNSSPACWLVEDGTGGLRCPERDYDGAPWLPDAPVVEIAHPDAVAYLAWRSRRDGREYRLSTEMEWEKAARGVDGRIYPWGDRFDPSLCNMRYSRQEGIVISPVDTYPQDRSVYGVRGLAGNAKDMTASTVVWAVADGIRRIAYVDRGGMTNSEPKACRIGRRQWYEPNDVWKGVVGFRLGCSLPPAPPAPDR